MLATLDKSLNAAFERASTLRGIANSKAANPLPMARQVQFPGDDGQIAKDEDRYQYHTGSVYSAIRVITSRMSGQPSFVGRMVNSPTRRSLKLFCDQGVISKDSLPASLKAHDPEKIEILEDHPLQQTVNDPNDMMVRQSLLSVTAANLQVTGRAFWLLTDRDDGRKGFLPLPSTWVKPIHVKGQPFAGWLVTPPGSTSKPMPVPRDEMAYFHLPDPSDPFGCLSPLQQMARTILADDSIQTAQQVAFSNGLTPGVAITVGEAYDITGAAPGRRVELDPHQKEQFMASIRRMYQGATKHGLPFVLDALIQDIKKISNTPDEMAFMDSGTQTEGRIYRGFGVNPISAGQVEGANRASSAIADHHLVMNTVNPILSLISQVVTKWLAPQFASDNEKLVFWLQPAEAFDPELDLKKWEFGARNHAVSRNEIRTKLLGLPALDDGDNIALPLTLDFEPIG